MKKKSLVVMATALMMAAALVVGGTLAYFTDKDDAENVFTVGNVDIELTEPNWKDNSKLMPSREIAKDPTITVLPTERAYTFMKVKLSDNFAELLLDYAKAHNMDLTNVEDQKALINDWFVSKTAPKIMSVNLADHSVILGVLSPKDPGESVTYFDAVTVPADVDANMIKANGVYKIYITAYGIQAEGFEGVYADAHADRQAAYDALFGE